MPQVTRRLPSSSGAGRPPSFDFDNEGWKEVEAVTGRAIGAAVRTEIVTVINCYLWTASAEATAGDLDDATKELRRIQTDVARARKALSAPSTSDAADLVHTLISRNLHHPLILDNLDQELKLDLVAGVLRAFDASCTRSIEQILSGEHTGRPAGLSWAAMIQALIEIADRNQLPTTVRKDDDVKIQHSPFVYVIDLLQSRFDPQYRRGMQSLSALAVAIDKARRVRKV